MRQQVLKSFKKKMKMSFKLSKIGFWMNSEIARQSLFIIGKSVILMGKIVFMLKEAIRLWLKLNMFLEIW